MSTKPNTRAGGATTSPHEVARESITPSSFTRAFWDATRERRFLLQYSEGSGLNQFFPQPISQRGSRRDLRWVETDPVGELFAYTITHRGPGPFHGHEPYVVVTVTLDAGVRVISNLVECPLDRIAIGMRVSGTWQPLSDGTHLLMFRPADDEARR